MSESKMLPFDLPKDHSNIIKVIGVGGGGSNAVDHMWTMGSQGVDYIVCNTDSQALDKSNVPTKIQLGASLTEGRGAGSNPEVGRNAAVESIDEVRALLEKNTTMVFVTAGMGGGTGTGAAPEIAKIAKELGILTVGIVTMPFSFEGKKRAQQAEEGIENMRNAVDALLVIKNDKLREVHGKLGIKEAFSKADEVLAVAARGISEVISTSGDINVDMNDVKTVMVDSGVAIMGSAVAEGEDRALKAARMAMESPLLNDNDITGARYVLLYITLGEDALLDEIGDITDFIQDQAGSTADVIWGYGIDESLGNKLALTVVATGFQHNLDIGVDALAPKAPEKKVVNLDEVERGVDGPLDNPFGSSTQRVSTENREPEPFIKQKEEPKAEETQPELRFEMKSKTADEPVETASNEQKPTTAAPKKEEVKRHVFMLDDNDEISEVSEDELTVTATASPEQNNEDELEITPRLTATERQEKIEKSFANIRDLNNRLRTPSGISQLENEPAFKRRNVNLSEQKRAEESNVSRFSLNEDNELKSNNSFLHDNVD